jgi:hypothetical protein
LCLHDVGHAAHNSDLNLIGKAKMIQTGVADDQMYAFGLKRLQLPKYWRVSHHHFDAIEVETDSRWEHIVFIQQAQIGTD